MQIGVIGLGTMGANLARNVARTKADVVVYNRTGEKTDAFLKTYGKEGTFSGAKSLAELCTKLRSPRTILLMVTSGTAVDALITELLPYLSKGDLLIDGGNSHYRDTERRAKILEDGGMHFLGLGVSGGEEGALRGPSLMPGGSKEAYGRAAPLLTAMAAEDGIGGKCVAELGPGGAGHFVKMVHNGIEYGVMQLIAEVFHLLKVVGGRSNAELADIFTEWNADPLTASFLLEITSEIFRTKDPETGKDLIDVILDSSSQKGTGKWATEAALELGVAVPTITAAVDARIVSSAKQFRLKRSTEVKHHGPHKSVEMKSADLLPMLVAAYRASILNTYAQGLQLLSAASDAYGWALPIPEICRLWRGGCIIRSGFLPLLQRSFSGDQKASLALRALCEGESQARWRQAVMLGAEMGIPIPAMSASLSYFDGYRSAWLPQGLTMAQREVFGAHGFERIDREGVFHITSS